MAVLFLSPVRTSTDALYVSARADVDIRPYVQFSGGLFVGGDAHIAPPRPQARNPLPPSVREVSRPLAVTEGEICHGSAVASN